MANEIGTSMFGRGYDLSLDGTPSIDSVRNKPVLTTPTLDKPSARGAIAGNVAAGVAEIGASVIQGVASSRQADRARSEARQLSNIRRDDMLENQKVSNQVRKKSLDQDQRQLEISQQRQQTESRYNKFLREFKNRMDNMNKMQEGASSLVSMMNKNTNAKDMVFKYWGV